MHNLTMEISDANGVNSIDIVTVKLLGSEENSIGVMNWEPEMVQCTLVMIHS